MAAETTPRALLDVATRAAQAGGAVLERWFRSADLTVEAKSEHDFVTRADHESEEAVVAVVREAFPDHEILGEERGLERADDTRYRWLIDPLDGTTNFLQGLPVFAVSVACQVKGESVAGVVLDPFGRNLFAAALGSGARWNGRPMQVSERCGLGGAFLATGYPFRARRALDIYLQVFREVFSEARAIRRCGAAALDLAYVAAGVYDGFFEFRLSPWDFAAAELLVREAGGRVTDLDGGDSFYVSGNVIAGPSAVHQALLTRVGVHASEAKLSTLDPLPIGP